MRDNEKILVALTGLPGVGKTRVCEFLTDCGAAVYSWGNIAVELITSFYGDSSWTSVKKFASEIEANDKTIVARYFLESSNITEDERPVIVVDGVKNLEQLRHIAAATGRTPVVVRVARREDERINAIVDRADFDDHFDLERMEMLTSLGLLQLIEQSQFTVDCTGIRLRKRDEEFWWIRLPEKFCAEMRALTSAISLCTCSPLSRGRMLELAAERATQNGYTPWFDQSEQREFVQEAESATHADLLPAP